MDNKTLKPNVEKQLQQIVDIVANGIQGPKGDKGEPGRDGGSLLRYIPSGANNDCIVVATGEGVTFSKTGQKVKLTVPEGVMLSSVQVRYSAQEMSTPACEINFGMGKSFDDMFIPLVQVCVMNEGARPYVKGTAYNFNSSHDTLQITGLTPSQPIMAKLVFM